LESPPAALVQLKGEPHGQEAMLMARQTAPGVQAGEYFVKVGDPNGKIWEVVDLRITTDGILHARLKTGDNSTMTIAAGVLLDRHFWQQVQT
jgi:hypothetical protein